MKHFFVFLLCFFMFDLFLTKPYNLFIIYKKFSNNYNIKVELYEKRMNK